MTRLMLHFLSLYECLSHSRFARVFIIGGIGVVAQTVAFELLGVLFHIFSLSTSVVIGAEIGILTNFYLNNRFSFRDRRNDTSLLSRLFRFHLVVSGSVFLQWLFISVVEYRTNDSLFIHAAYAAGIVLGFAWNYTFYLLFVWKRSKSLSAIVHDI